MLLFQAQARQLVYCMLACMGLFLLMYKATVCVCCFIDVTSKIGSDEESTLCARTACMREYACTILQNEILKFIFVLFTER